MGKVQRILLNIQKLVVGTEDFILKLDHTRYPHGEHNEVKYLWKKISALNIQLDIQGSWNPIAWTKVDTFIMEYFISKGHSGKVLKILNNMRVYMKQRMMGNQWQAGHCAQKSISAIAGIGHLAGSLHPKI